MLVEMEKLGYKRKEKLIITCPYSDGIIRYGIRETYRI